MSLTPPDGPRLLSKFQNYEPPLLIKKYKLSSLIFILNILCMTMFMHVIHFISEWNSLICDWVSVYLSVYLRILPSVVFTDILRTFRVHSSTFLPQPSVMVCGWPSFVLLATTSGLKVPPLLCFRRRTSVGSARSAWTC